MAKQLSTLQMAGLVLAAGGAYMLYQGYEKKKKYRASCTKFDTLPKGEFGVGGVSCTCGYDKTKGVNQRLTFCPVNGIGATAAVAEHLDGDAADPTMRLQTQAIADLTTHLPAVNPLASIPLSQRLGEINPVKFNEWHDPRGAPRILQTTTINEEQAFLKHPKAVDSYLDKQELVAAAARGPRVNVFV